MGICNWNVGILVVFRGLKFESDPIEIGFAFHGAGTDIDEKDRFRSGTKHPVWSFWEA
jgi:hypothetical protein